MKATVVNYNITNNITVIRGNESVLIGGEGHQINRNTFNFHDCNIELVGNLNELARSLSKKGNADDAEELAEVIEVLDEVKEGASKEEVKKKGVFQKLGRILKDLGDKDSTLHKTVEGIKHGVSIAQDVAKQYNKVAQWVGLPVVPEPFLKKEEE